MIVRNTCNSIPSCISVARRQGLEEDPSDPVPVDQPSVGLSSSLRKEMRREKGLAQHLEHLAFSFAVLLTLRSAKMVASGRKGSQRYLRLTGASIPFVVSRLKQTPGRHVIYCLHSLLMDMLYRPLQS